MGDRTRYEWRRDDYVVSTDAARLDVDVVASYLGTHSYWARGIPREIVERSLAGSLCFGLYRGAPQVGFGRVVTDLATFAYLGDIFVLEAHRGRGLSKWLMECILAHPELQGLRRWMLATRDAHTLYERFGFRALAAPEKFMELHDPEVYGPRS
ncbi:MAG: GNAT family N-acetyltransferase [Myxococcota bacterium]